MESSTFEAVEKLKILPMWHTFWKGKLEFGLISFWMSKWFSLIHLISFENKLHVWRFLPDVGTKFIWPQKTSTTFFPKSSPSKTEYHLATRKGPTSSNPVACCHFVKESHGFSPWHLFRWAAISKLFVHHHRGEVLSPWDSHHPIWGTTFWRSDPISFGNPTCRNEKNSPGRFGFGNTPLKKCHGSQSPIHAKGMFCPKKMVGPNHASCWNQSEIFCQHSLKKLHSRSPTTRTTTSKPLTTQPQQPIPSKFGVICVHLCLNPNFFVGAALAQGLRLIHGIGLNTSNIVRFRHLDLGHQLPVFDSRWQLSLGPQIDDQTYGLFFTFGGESIHHYKSSTCL